MSTRQILVPVCIKKSLAVSLVLAISMVGVSYGAGGDMGRGTEPLTDGSAAYPWLIQDLADFDVFANQANAATYWSSGVYTKLMCNIIDLSVKPSYPVAVIAPDLPDTTDGFDGIPFEGVFDGNGCVVADMTIDTAGAADNYLGLFGYIEGSNAQVKNLGVEDVNITGGDLSHDIGGLCGYNWKGTITNCYVAGTITGGDESYDIGGLFGKIYGGAITNCYTTAIVNSGRESYDVGGLCGKNNSCEITSCHAAGTITGEARSHDLGSLCGKNDYIITNSYATGAITSGDQSYDLGGLCGNNDGGAISDCYATGTVCSGRESYDIGGLVGYNNNGSLNDCYATGAIAGDDRSYNLGSLCGNNDDGAISNCYATGYVGGKNESHALGGLVGHNDNDITNCYATGAVAGAAGSYDIGGLCGFSSAPGTITESFWDVQTSGIGSEGDDNYGATGKTTAQMQTLSTFTDAGWDFDVEPLWKMPFYENGYPMLAWQWNGNGSQTQPYLIENLANFDAFADQANAATYWAEYVYTKLMCDIDLTGRSYTTAVIAPDMPDTDKNFNGIPFEGVFDGDDHIISNMTIDTAGAGNDYLGLFGSIAGYSAQIKNLGVENVNTTGGDGSHDVGGLCGLNEEGTITNCHVAGTVIGGTGSEDVGGLCGENDGTVTSSYATGSVSGNSYFGGLCGYNYEGTITDCYATSLVTGDSDSWYMGGLCGENDGGAITDCYATGAVINGDGCLGGLCGETYWGTITNCYATGEVTGWDESDDLGGLCGKNNYRITNCYATGSVTGGNGSGSLGGLCGKNADEISNCYATGAVTGENNLGGLCGYNYGAITDCFWDTQTSGMTDGVGNEDPDPAGVTGKTTAEMQTESTFTDANWDFSVVPDWHMPFEATGYPMLGWQKDIPGDFTGRYGVDMVDFAILSNAWLSDDTPSANWNEDCDLDDNGEIDIRDMERFVENWLCD